MPSRKGNNRQQPGECCSPCEQCALMHLKCVPWSWHTNIYSSKCLPIILIFCYSTTGKKEGAEKDSMDEGKCN